jgi:cytochrome c-type biogenesis protein CcmH/NrfG
LTPWLRIEPQPYEGALVKRIAIVFFLSCFVCLAQARDITSADSEDPMLMQGKTLIAKNDWSEASALFEIFVKQNPQDADGFNLLGYSYRNLRRYDESFAAYRQALTLDPKHRGRNVSMTLLHLAS